MKKIILSILVCFTGLNLLAQSNEFAMMKQVINTEKRVLITEGMQLDEEQAKVFWPIYASYDAALLDLSNERLDVIADYMLDFYDLSDEKAESLLKRVFEIDQKKLDIQKEYYDKFNAVLPATLVGKFFQIDNYIDLLISLQRSETIPLIQTGNGG